MCAFGGTQSLGMWVVGQGQGNFISQHVVHFLNEGSWKFVEFPDEVFSSHD